MYGFLLCNNVYMYNIPEKVKCLSDHIVVILGIFKYPLPNSLVLQVVCREGVETPEWCPSTLSQSDLHPLTRNGAVQTTVTAC